MELITIRDQIIQILKLGGLELSKWGANCSELLQRVSDQSEERLAFDKDCNSRILGFLWDSHDDTFHFPYNPPQSPSAITKRVILSEVSRLFDPLSLLGPVVVVAKFILQDLWQSGVQWDESVPQDMHTKWFQLKLLLADLNELQIPRCVKEHPNSESIQIHGFCDASQRAYGACIYIRSDFGQGDYRSHLLCSRFRITPIKTISLPRLELSAALLLAQLISKSNPR